MVIVSYKDCSEIKDTKLNAHILSKNSCKNFIIKKLSDFKNIETC